MQLIHLILVASTAATYASAIAMPQPEVDLVARAKVPCDKIEKYTSAYFHSKMCSRPAASKCLFYTRDQGKKARWYAKQHGLTTIWNHWPQPFYNKKMVDDNPLRCIIQSKDDRTTYFQTMSQAFAEACTVFATVMTDDLKQFPPEGIWKDVEYPALQRGSIYGKVNSIDAIEADGKKIKSPYWVRNGVRQRDELREEEEGGYESEGEDEEDYEGVDQEDHEHDDQDTDLIPRDPANKTSAPKSTPKPTNTKSGSKSTTTTPGTKPDTKPGSNAGPSTSSSTCGIGQLGLEADFDGTGPFAVQW